MGDCKLTREEIEAEVLRRSGLVIVSDDEATVLGGNRILPWRHGYRRTMAGVKKEEPSDDVGGDEKPNAETLQKPISQRVRTAIKFKTKFDVVELDAGGRVIDKGETPPCTTYTTMRSFAVNCCHKSFAFMFAVDDE